MSKLQDQVAVVTGAGRGIGRAIALQMAAAGARVALVARSVDQLEETARLITDAGGTALVVPTDVTDENAVRIMEQHVEAELGAVDILVNNAGSFFAIGPIWQTDPAQWWRDMTINVLGVYLCCRELVPDMIEQGHGRIINLIGGGTAGPLPYGSGYGTSKAAVMRFTETLAAEVKDYNIKVFAMGPGLVRTAMTEYQLESEAGQEWLPRIHQAFQDGVDVPPEAAGKLAVELASGRFDALHGRAVSVGFDHEAMEANVETILARDLYTLRLNRLDA
jgi:NAD(P)-dependent dehydrogenase (short-subunit alcohol dehydrogenase family)